MSPKTVTGKIKIKNPEDGATTKVYFAVTPANELEKRAYYAECYLEPSSQTSYNSEDAKKTI